MADGTQTIKVPRSGGAPEDYDIGGAANFDLIAARAVFDGSGAAGDFLPTLQILNAAGEVMATVFGSPVAAGDSREVTFAPFLGSQGSGEGGGIDFNKENTHAADGADGNYLEINAIGTGVNPFSDYSVAIKYSGDEGSTNGAILIENNSITGAPANVPDIKIQNNADNGIELLDDGKGGIFLLATGSGSGAAAGRMLLECNGGITALVNNDVGIALFSTGNFDDGYGMHIGASNGIILGANFDPLDPSTAPSRFLVIDTGEFGPNLLRSDIVLAQTTDPGVPGAFWNDSGTVKIST